MVFLRRPQRASLGGPAASASTRMPRAAARLRELVVAYRQTGADVPFGDPLPSHGSEMEGWFWRVTDSASGRVVVALCSVNQHAEGDWATVAVGLHPGGFLRTAALGAARAERSQFALSAGTAPEAAVTASADRLQIDLDDVHLDLRFADQYVWPKAFGGGGLFSAIPFLTQYWHPYRLGGTATGTVGFGGAHSSFDDATLYAEKNWGPGFPERWWWGQAHDFGGADVSVAFTGGLLQIGPIRRDVGLVVVRLGDRLIRIAPPAPVRSRIGEERWTIRARSPRYQIDLNGDAAGLTPHALPVPLLAERRNVGAAVEHLAGRLHCVVREFGRVVFDGSSDLAGLEVGSLPDHS
jgi:tocopherol cyclase